MITVIQTTYKAVVKLKREKFRQKGLMFVFQASILQLLKCVYNCEDQSSLHIFLPSSNLCFFIHSLESLGTFRSEDDYEYEFSVVSMRTSKNVGPQNLIPRQHFSTTQLTLCLIANHEPFGVMKRSVCNLIIHCFLFTRKSFIRNN